MKFGRGNFKGNYSFKNTLLREEFSFKNYIGLPQWGTPEWKGLLYPQKCPPKKFLEEYAKRLNCVEVSSTFYSTVSKERFLEWRSMVPGEFRFLPKWPQSITHQNYLTDCNKEVSEFIDCVSVLENNLGTTFLQLPPQFSSDFKRGLFYFLESLPEGFPIALEFRHRSWFENERVYSKLEEYLIKKNISMVCSDTAGRRDVFHKSFTGNRNIIRYLSDENNEHDQIRLKQWKDWIDSQNKGGDCFFIIHRPDNAFAPHLFKFWDNDFSESILWKEQALQSELF